MSEVNIFKIDFSISAGDDEGSDKALSSISTRMDELDEAFGSPEFRNIFRILFAFAQLDVLLAESKAALLARNDTQKKSMDLAPEYMAACKGIVPPVILYEETGVPYYNTSAYILSDCLAGELVDMLKAYAAGYSPSVQVVMSHVSFNDNLGKPSKSSLIKVVQEALLAGTGLSDRARLQVASELLLETGAEDPVVTCLKDMRGYTVVEQVK